MSYSLYSTPVSLSYLLNFLNLDKPENYLTYTNIDTPFFSDVEEQVYKNGEEGLADQFEQSGGVTIKWFFLKEIELTQASFVSLSQIMSQIGGFSSVVLTLFAIMKNQTF